MIMDSLRGLKPTLLLLIEQFRHRSLKSRNDSLQSQYIPDSQLARFLYGTKDADSSVDLSRTRRIIYKRICISRVTRGASAMFRIHAGSTEKYCDGLSRRNFVQIGLAGMGSFSLP